MLRVTLAASAAAALLGLGVMVAFAAPSSLGRAASPEGGAARAMYCGTATKRQRAATVAAYRKRMVVDRARFYRSHRKARQRRTFVKLQRHQLALLQKKLKQCE